MQSLSLFSSWLGVVSARLPMARTAADGISPKLQTCLGDSMSYNAVSFVTTGLLAFLLTISASFAQSYPCDQSMITGMWVLPALGSGNAMCKINIGTSGAFSSSCLIYTGGATYTIQAQPTGTLTIDKTCHVTGEISYVWNVSGSCGPGNYTYTYTEKLSPQLWRSLDGSRLSGYMTDVVSYTESSSKCGNHGGTFQPSYSSELTLIPQPPSPH